MVVTMTSWYWINVLWDNLSIRDKHIPFNFKLSSIKFLYRISFHVYHWPDSNFLSHRPMKIAIQRRFWYWRRKSTCRVVQPNTFCVGSIDLTARRELHVIQLQMHNGRGNWIIYYRKVLSAIELVIPDGRHGAVERKKIKFQRAGSKGAHRFWYIEVASCVINCISGVANMPRAPKSIIVHPISLMLGHERILWRRFGWPLTLAACY